MNELLELAESLAAAADEPNGKSPLRHLGFISCANRVDIRHVPFYEPCIIAVLAGRKVILDKQRSINCEAGEVITVPGPGSYDLRNEPDLQCGRYRALVIPFEHAHLENLRSMHGIAHVERSDQIGVLKFRTDATLNATIRHYLECPNDPRLLTHRLTEILLLLMGQDEGLMSYAIAGEGWAQRVRTILSGDLVREWTIGEVCERLATSETTLRRKLREEDCGFREILFELRLANGLTQLLQTSLPVYRIAYECGYQSVSRFTSNFRKRFGLSPTEFRHAADEKGQKTPASGQSEIS